MKDMIELVESKWINAFITLLINLGSSYLVNDVQTILQGVFKYKFMKWLVVFAICFASTKDIYVSIIVSVIFGVTVWALLDIESDLYLPKLKLNLKRKIREKLLDSINNV
tara:strand:- start:19287 stop:19616 length:330 start_codon:yes stop_codon:yes gene_type:complete